MKKVLLLFTLILFLMIFDSCRKDLVEKKKESKDSIGSTNNIESCQTPCLQAYHIGIKHNEILAYIDNGMTDEDTASVQSVYEAEKRLIKNYFSANPVCGYDSNLVDELVRKTNDFYIEVTNSGFGFFNNLTACNRLIDTVLSKLTVLMGMEQDIITSEEEEFIKEILDSVKNVQTDQRFDAYEELVDAFDSKWASLEFDTCNNKGYLSKIMIRVMENSYNFWTNYPHDINERIAAIPAWVALDVIGAIGGAVASAIHNGSAAQIGASALLGAGVTSSPAMRWFRKLFK